MATKHNETQTLGLVEEADKGATKRQSAAETTPTAEELGADQTPLQRVENRLTAIRGYGDFRAWRSLLNTDDAEVLGRAEEYAKAHPGSKGGSSAQVRLAGLAADLDGRRDEVIKGHQAQQAAVEEAQKAQDTEAGAKVK